MGFMRLFIVCIFLCTASFAKDKDANNKDDDRTLYMKDERGRPKSFKVKKLTKKTIERAALPQMDIAKKSSLCQNKGRRETANLEFVETELELQTLVDSLKDSDEPIDLSTEQKVFIAQIPYCEPFILNLNILSRLLAGWKYLELK